MTISNTSRTAGPFIGNGITKDFPFSYKVFDRSDVLVAVTDSTGQERLLTLDADYTVVLNTDQNNSPGGMITKLTALATGSTLAATSNIPIVQSLDLTNAGGFYPQVINAALDRLVINMQQLAARVGLGQLGVGAAGQLAQILGFIDLLAASAGATLIGFLQSGTGAIRRLLQDRLRDTVHVEDYPSTGGDDAIAVRAARDELKRRGGGILYFRRSSYVFKSFESPPSAVSWQNDPCVLFDGCVNIKFAGSAAITIDNSIAAAHPNGSGASHFGFHNCKNITGVLPSLVGNRTGLAPNKFNNGVWFESCINVPLTMRFTGDYNGGSCLAGGHIFDTAFPVIYAEQTSFGADVTCLENVTFEGMVITNPASVFVAGVKLFTDPVSVAYNVSGRQLVAGMSSNVHVKSISANGAGVAVYVDGVDGIIARVDAFSGQNAAVIETTAATHALGKVTKNVTISGTARGLTGSAVVLNTQGYGLDSVSVRHLTVSNCASYAIASLNNANLGLVTISDCDFSKQALTIENAFAQDIGNAGGAITNVHGYNPRSISINRAMPGGLGIGNKSVNNWPFAIEVTVNTTGLEYVMHIVEPDGTDINLGVASPKVPQAVTLSPKEAIYFEAALPTQWQWRGL